MVTAVLEQLDHRLEGIDHGRALAEWSEGKQFVVDLYDFRCTPWHKVIV